ncbi:DUF4403 family protein [Algoriphagus halophytocola]|uniref:DUF4403 family protein n=1 Tax=Algoriphagus halophytocola TaxID=2991499 RepID=UPI0022DE826D|nr:DUF4403 family protein [Algoriphagus sp. TR-M9]WBL42486.1 DUF4403 family protein [Algoriphagus sp. TR-M9]
MKIQFRWQFILCQLSIVLAIFILFSCKSLDPTANPGPGTPPPPSSSSVNVPLKLPKETLSKLLNGQIPTTLLQEQGMDLGGGVTGDLQLSRNGQITWTALDSQRIQLTVPINVSGRVGLKPKGLGSLFQSKLPLDEDFAPVFIVDPVIHPDWSIGAEQFELMELGGSLGVDVLGMQVDLSGLLAKEISKWGNEYLGEGKQIASLKTMVDLAWAQVGRPFSVNWVGGERAFSIQPQAVKLKEFFDEEQNYNLWLGMNGKINSHPAGAAPSRAFPLPDLSGNENEKNEFEMLIPFSLDYAFLDGFLQENVAGKTFRIDKKTSMTPSNIRTQAFGDLLAINMDFFAEQTNGKRLEGTLFVVGQPEYDSENERLVFDQVNFKMESGSFGAQTGVGLKKRKIIRRIENRAVFPIGSLLEESLSNISERLQLSTPITDLKIQELHVEPAGFYPMHKELVIQMKAEGRINVDWK